MISYEVRFDKERLAVLRKRIDDGLFRSIGHTAAAIRGTAMRLIVRSREPAPPGEPVHTRGLAKRRDAILFEVDRERDDALIGFTYAVWASDERPRARRQLHERRLPPLTIDPGGRPTWYDLPTSSMARSENNAKELTWPRTKIGFELYYGVAPALYADRRSRCDDRHDAHKATLGPAATTLAVVESQRVVSIAASINSRWCTTPTQQPASPPRALTSYTRRDDRRGPDFDYTLEVSNGQPVKGEQTYEFTASPTDEAGREPVLANLYC